MIRTRHPRHPLAPALVALALTATLAACGQTGTDAAPTSATSPTTTAPTGTPGDDAPTSEDDMSTDRPHVTPVEPTEPGSSGQGSLPTGPVDAAVTSREDVTAAVRAEAERLGVSVDDVRVAGYAEVTWSDGSIGCPQPGMMYTQALVPGHQLILEVDGQLASYHAATGRAFSYCANPSAPVPGGSGTTSR